jgi:hypothetical protein
MSCISCNFYEGGFKTENDFREFEDLLQRLVRDEKFVCLGEIINSKFFDIRYQCKCCGTAWVLSIPDQSFRGGWREE